jgi:tetratricopeptide (TPR) repeat protein
LIEVSRTPLLSTANSLSGLILATLLASSVGGEAPHDAVALFDRAMAAAEVNLRAGHPEVAEMKYREAMMEGWLLLGTMDRVEGRLPEAESAFRVAAVGRSPRALEALAFLLLQKGESAEAVKILEETRSLAPADLEVAFALADAYLRRQEIEPAARLFAQIVAARPIPQTHVLIGGAYRDAREFVRAEAELQAALNQDPQVRRAHYLLAMAILDQKGSAGVEQAVPHFQAELRLAPEDPAANLELGVALVEGQRPAEAVAALALAARSGPPSARAFYYLGRAQVGAGRPSEAAASLKRALELSGEQGGNAQALRGIHIQLGQALRAIGQAEEAAAHFAEAARLSGQQAGEERDQLARHLSDSAVAPTAMTPLPVLESTPLAGLPASERQELKRRVKVALTRAYLNLGVMEAQRERFAAAADLLENAAGLDPDFPQVQSSLGVAHFNARQFDKATGPLTRAVAAQPADLGLRRMLALAWLNTESYAKAAELLRDDPERETDSSLAFAYGMALVKSDRPADAERVFAQLLRTHGDSAELSVLLGQAHAQQGDFAAAIEALQRALQLRPDVPEASSTLGLIYLRQGRFPEAETALRAELKGHPSDLVAQQNLASVLDLQQRSEEAVVLLRAVVQAKPELSDARYLLGKILLAQGAAAEAVEQLQTAAGIAPRDANIHYQLGKAYQKLGKGDLAEQEFERFRELKASK